jgi:MtaA/CmuA family methyltransferase
MALIELQRQYRFDGILVNLPGRDPKYTNYIDHLEERDNLTIIHWKNGCYTEFSHDDVPHYYQEDGSRYFPNFDDLDPDNLFYIEPWDITDINYPYKWGFEENQRSKEHFFPDYHIDTIRKVRELAGKDISVHSEVFSPWSQFLELLNYENALLAILDDPQKAKDCLDQLTSGAIALGKLQAAEDIDAILISSAFAGAGLISRQHYQEFVLPFERRLIQELREVTSLPIYTHTCGAIGDRLDLMMETGTNGVDTLDPPPLGTVELEEAKEILGGKVFIKGNINPVDTLLNGSQDSVREDVKHRIEIGKHGGGYILSSACSVAPHTPPENIALLADLVDKYGWYNK